MTASGFPLFPPSPLSTCKTQHTRPTYGPRCKLPGVQGAAPRPRDVGAASEAFVEVSWWGGGGEFERRKPQDKARPKGRAELAKMGVPLSDEEALLPGHASQNIHALVIPGMDITPHLNPEYLHPTPIPPTPPRPAPIARAKSSDPPIRVHIAREQGDLQGIRQSDKTVVENKTNDPEDVYRVNEWRGWDKGMANTGKVEGDTLTFGEGEGGIITRATFDHNRIPTPDTGKGYLDDVRKRGGMPHDEGPEQEQKQGQDVGVGSSWWTAVGGIAWWGTT
ncbi:hypothetical protein M427DRAFT_45857 [Gonapodya prolifera JEL478]|uniref:Uncharacterized protein n=1 Tax=Gonapodya prolifera (strain JEL478) TaxID=1344416 RepID=A0A139AAA6_GONPJ|nr:hypothetical protein M427DRAFT_45857 [Gonapodya prolifera JEL478]|eukprot:KXS13303.1 hypothetical protein M427DRAFT_45857 [Gonapodya prolifera JEL478]